MKCHGTGGAPSAAASPEAGPSAPLAVRATTRPQVGHSAPGRRLDGVQYREQVSHHGTAAAPAPAQTGDNRLRGPAAAIRLGTA